MEFLALAREVVERSESFFGAGLDELTEEYASLVLIWGTLRLIVALSEAGRLESALPAAAVNELKEDRCAELLRKVVAALPANPADDASLSGLSGILEDIDHLCALVPDGLSL